MWRSSSQRRSSFLIVITSIASLYTLWSVTNSWSLASKSEPGSSPVGQIPYNLVHLSNELEIGSDSYYHLPSVRSELIREVQAARSNLLRAFSTDISVGPLVLRRAVVVFLPSGIPKFVAEAKWLYLSIGLMRTRQATSVLTDFVIFTPPENVDDLAEDFGCAVEIDPRGSERCIVLPHVPLKDRLVPTGQAAPPLVKYANYVDSMLVLAEFKHASVYSDIIRSDLDAFITPGFSDWFLDGEHVLAVGDGGYGHENANRHLSWIMKEKLGIDDNGILGVGSTWFGRSDVMVACAQLTIAAMNWLQTQEFNEYEQYHSGTDSWPYWHWPVLLLYGGHIAVNQIPKSKVLKNSRAVAELDKPTSSSTELISASVKHLHCFQGVELFSKLRFHLGQYKTLSLWPFLAMNTTEAYSTTIAVSSARLSMTELRTYMADAFALSNGDWIRPDHQP